MKSEERREARLPPMLKVDPGQDFTRVRPRTMVFICQGPSCSERGSVKLCEELRRLAAASEEGDDLRICETTCLDHCASGPNVVMSPEPLIQHGIAAERAPDLFRFLSGIRDDVD